MKDKGFMEFSIKQLNKYMSNMGSQQFNYEVLRAAFDSDPRIQNIIKDFDHQSVTLKDGEVDDLENDAQQSDGDSVATMARNATDLGDNDL
jgi:hypothetical protein